MILKDEKSTIALGGKLGKAIAAGDKIALNGTLGAGKTTFTRGVLQGLGFAQEVPSPTFAIVQQYEPPDTRIPIAHVDLYRIEHLDEVQELGLDDILVDGAMIVEWPERLPPAYWNDALHIDIEILPDDTRRLTWRAGPAWKDRWPTI